MSALYEDGHRQLQAQFDTQRLADRIRKQMDWARDVLPQGDPAGAKP